MSKTARIRELLLRLRRFPALATGAALFVLAAAIGLTTHQLRQQIRDQIVGRDAVVLHAVLALQMDESAAELGAESLSDPAAQMRVVLITSRLRGVMGARLLDAQGRFLESFPAAVREADLSAEDLDILRRFQPLSQFDDALPSAAVFYPLGTNGLERIPLLTVSLPIHSSRDPRLLGVVQYLLEGQTIREEFQRVDRSLLTQALTAFLAFGMVLFAAMTWAFRRVRRSHRLLSERTADLIRANQELALAARTTAVGAVVSHLIHGIRSPLAGLTNFVRRRGDETASEVEQSWQEAAASTQRMQAMINEIVNLLREEEVGSQYEVSPAELVGVVERNLAPRARQQGILWSTEVESTAALDNRTANLVALILKNLAENAIQATPRGKTVTVHAHDQGARLRIQVSDQGPGMPASGTETVFLPRRSAKEGGSGIGLAISKQLANHLGATLELLRTSSEGCVFQLIVPLQPAVDERVAERS